MSCSETSTPQLEAVDGRATEEPDEEPHDGLGGEEVVSDLKGAAGRLHPRVPFDPPIGPPDCSPILLPIFYRLPTDPFTDSISTVDRSARPHEHPNVGAKLQESAVHGRIVPYLNDFGESIALTRPRHSKWGHIGQRFHLFDANRTGLLSYPRVAKAPHGGVDYRGRCLGAKNKNSEALDRMQERNAGYRRSC